MKRRLCFLYMLFIICMVACSIKTVDNQEIQPTTILPSQTMNEPTETIVEPTETIMEPTKALDEVAPISLSDFDVSYQGLVLNASTSLIEMAQVLNVDLLDDNDTNYKAYALINDHPYEWRVLNYPSADEVDIKIEYVINKNDLTGRIVYIDLMDNPTSRDVHVGDSKDKITEKYGELEEDSYNTEGWYDVIVDTYSLLMEYDVNTEQIIRIRIDYDTNQAMADMDIPSFD